MQQKSTNVQDAHAAQGLACDPLFYEVSQICFAIYRVICVSNITTVTVRVIPRKKEERDMPEEHQKQWRIRSCRVLSYA